MTIWIYVDNRKMVGDEEHLKVFATARTRRELGLPSTIRKAWRSNIRFLETVRRLPQGPERHELLEEIGRFRLEIDAVVARQEQQQSER
jgi:hypothetical protein